MTILGTTFLFPWCINEWYTPMVCNSLRIPWCILWNWRIFLIREEGMLFVEVQSQYQVTRHPLVFFFLFFFTFTASSYLLSLLSTLETNVVMNSYVLVYMLFQIAIVSIVWSGLKCDSKFCIYLDQDNFSFDYDCMLTSHFAFLHISTQSNIT